MRNYAPICFIFLFCSCNKTYQSLSNYYQVHKDLHEKIASSLQRIQTQTKCTILLKKNNSLNQVVYMYLPGGSSTYRSIYFDSALQIVQKDDDYNLATAIPKSLISDFNAITYHAIKTDTTGTFFAYKYINDRSNYEVGVFLPLSSWKEHERDFIRELLKNKAYITKDIVP